MITEVLTTLFGRVLGDWIERLQRRTRRLPWKSIAQVSNRLAQVINLANNHPRGRANVFSYLVEGNPSITLTQLEQACAGAAEPTIELVRQVCDSIGASYQYVWHGKGAPFSPREEDYLPIREYLDLFKDPGLSTIYFVRSTTYPHLSFIALQYNDFKFRVLPHEFHVSAENGGGGAASLSELAHLSEAYHRECLHEVVAWGRDVPLRVAEGVLAGQLHCSAIFQKGSKSSHWWDDLADVEHKRYIAKDYKENYDQEFFNAQELIRWARKNSA